MCRGAHAVGALSSFTGRAPWSVSTAYHSGTTRRPRPCLCGGGQLVADRAHAELVASGARPRTKALSGRDALTPSERRVARMAAEGLTNREIAQALFVTMRTVEVHLTHAYQELDISSREQLPQALDA